MNERSVMPVPACGLLVADLKISAQTSEQHEVADHEPARPAVMFRTLTTRSDATTLTRGMSHRAATIPTVLPRRNPFPRPPVFRDCIFKLTVISQPRSWQHGPLNLTPSRLNLSLSQARLPCVRLWVSLFGV